MLHTFVGIILNVYIKSYIYIYANHIETAWRCRRKNDENYWLYITQIVDYGLHKHSTLKEKAKITQTSRAIGPWLA